MSAGMKNGLYVSLSAQISLERRLETIASNIANANTPGYRVDGVTFASELAKAGDAKVAFVNEGEGYISNRAGRDHDRQPARRCRPGRRLARRAVERPDDLHARRPHADERNRRPGLDDRRAVLDAAGAPIQLDPSGGPPKIARDGMITQNGRQVGALGLFSLDPGAKLTRAGTSGFTSDKPAQPILDFAGNGVVQGSSRAPTSIPCAR